MNQKNIISKLTLEEKIAMIHAAGLGVAFCAKPAVQADAPHRVNERDLTRILDFLR